VSVAEENACQTYWNDSCISVTLAIQNQDTERSFATAVTCTLQVARSGAGYVRGHVVEEQDLLGRHAHVGNNRLEGHSLGSFVSGTPVTP
jgi:hypothetical protein